MYRQRATLFAFVALLLVLTAGLAAGWYREHQLAQADHERALDARQLLDTVDTYYFADEAFTQRITCQIPHRGRRFRVMVEPLEQDLVAKADSPN